MLSEHVRHGDIWKSKDGNKVFVLFYEAKVGEKAGIILVNGEAKAQKVAGTVMLKDSPFDPTAEGAELIWRAPEENKNNFNMSGDVARTLAAGVMLLNKEQTEICQQIVNSLNPIIQAQPPRQG